MTADTEHLCSTRLDKTPPAEAGTPADAQTPDTPTWLERLRQEFPHWGIMRPSSRGLWLAMSKGITLRAPTPAELRDKIRDAGGDRRTPA
jgi:hypothetical protein